MKPKHLPRLWCALQGLLPLEAAGRRPHESSRLLPAQPRALARSSEVEENLERILRIKALQPGSAGPAE